MDFHFLQKERIRFRWQSGWGLPRPSVTLELAGCSCGRDERGFQRMFRVVVFGRRIDDQLLRYVMNCFDIEGVVGLMK